jgi:hypothetical protein
MKDKQKRELAAQTTPGWIVYQGPHQQIRITSVPELGEISLERGRPVQVPVKVAAVLIDNKKAVGAAAPSVEDKAATEESSTNSAGEAQS